VKTRVISLAGSDANLTSHLNDVARAGLTGQADLPVDQAQISNALSAIVDQEQACDVKLDKQIQLSAACRGAVRLGMRELACDTDDGFRLVDPSLIRLSGHACQTYKSDSAGLQIDYPCSALATP
jgi:predicted protein tyrosine phosphatase